MPLTITKPAKPINIIIFDVLDKAVAPRLQQDVKAIAEDVRQKLIDRINSDDFNFPEYSAKYAKYKEEHFPGKPFLVATEEYINSIEVKETPQGYVIGVGDNIHFGDKNSPITMRDLALILEFGWSRYDVFIPPRPHWRLALANLQRRKEKLTQDMKKTATAEAQKALDKYLRQPQVKEQR